MSLLADLRAAAPTDVDEPPWMTFKRVMPLLVPGFEIVKMDTYSDGRVGLRARTPMEGKGRYYLVMVLEPVGTGLKDGRREVRLGVAKYRDEADVMIYDRPFRAFVDPQPGAVAAWLTGVLMTQDPYSPRRDTWDAGAGTAQTTTLS